jgi:uncharacterized membrane protein
MKNPVSIVVALCLLLAAGARLLGLLRQKDSHVTEVTSGSLPRGRFAPTWRQYRAFSIFAFIALLFAGTGVWGLVSGYPSPGVSLVPTLFSLFLLYFFGTVYLRHVTVTDLVFQVSGPWGWRTQRIPISEIASIRILAPASISPMLELRLRGRSLSFSVSSEFARCLTGATDGDTSRPTGP